MAAQVSDQQLSEAVCKSIKDGTYPEDESVISAELSSPALENLSQMLNSARDEVKASIRELSRLSAGDVDGWITEAKQLRQDLDESQQQTAEIQKLAAQRHELKNAALDASNKVDFLKRELAFNNKLTFTLEKILEVRNTVDGAQDALVAMQIRDATDLVMEAETRLAELEGCQRTGLVNLMRAKITDIRNNLAKTAMGCWQRLLLVDRENYEIQVRDRFERGPRMDINNTIFVLATFDLLKGRLVQLKNDAEALIFRPIIGKSTSKIKRAIEIKGPILRASGQRPDTVERLLADVSAGFNYFSLILSTSVAAQLLQILSPAVVAQMINGPLASSVPPDLSGISSFAETLSLVKTFAETMVKRKWPGSERLFQWVENAPKVWLSHRSNSSLSSIRQLLARGIGKPRSVERVETQQVPIEDKAFQENGDQDNWNASWSDEENDAAEDAEKAIPKKADSAEDDDAAGAWGWDDDDKKPNEQKPSKAPSEEEEDEGEAWGWGDDDQPATMPSAQSPKKSKKSPPPLKTLQPTSREITLRETYHVTAVPEQIVEIVVQAVDDANRLTASPSGLYGPVQPAGTGLYTLPDLLLSIFRACAPNAYLHDPSGNMFLYNDSLYLAEQLRAFATHHASKHASSPLDLTRDIAALETFGKGSYGKEMEAQRTVVRDLLDGAQGFAHCTEAPFAEACELAVSSATDRLRDLHAQWSTVLSPSALQQSLGSLLATMTDKVLVDVEELGDISEPESQRLVAFSQRIEQLEFLFLPPTERAAADGGVASAEERDALGARAAMAASVYTPGLLKFQWLGQLLEGSLADIRYWWTESDLGLYFAPDEVVDLIEALFTDSEHRRRAIGEIRRGAPGR